MSVETYKVWDELNSEEQFAQEIEAFDASDAAEEYAEQDMDGNCDGIYTETDRDGRRDVMMGVAKNGHPILVRAPDGTLRRFRVGIVEYLPVYMAEEVEQP